MPCIQLVQGASMHHCAATCARLPRQTAAGGRLSDAHWLAAAWLSDQLGRLIHLQIDGFVISVGGLLCGLLGGALENGTNFVVSPLSVAKARRSISSCGRVLVGLGADWLLRTVIKFALDCVR